MGKDEANIEAEIKAKGLTAPRLTPADIDTVIAGEDYHVFPGTTLTVCCLRLRNGFTVTGESAAASPENFNQEIGRKIARENARQKIWALEGYLLRQRLSDYASHAPDTIGDVDEDEKPAATLPSPAPVDRTQRTLVDGAPVTEDHRELQENGQQKDYVVLSAEERAKGFVRPVRTSYVHEKCGTSTRMSRAIAETYARDPGFYSGTFCVGCGAHFPVGAEGEFVWEGTTEKVGV